MQNQSNSQILPQDLLEKDCENHQANVVLSGEYVAKLFKFYRRLQNPYVSHTLPLKLVSGKSIYNKHKDAFDKFAAIAYKNKFDVERYIKFCVERGINEKLVEVCLTSTTMISKYAAYVSTYEKRKKIYTWVVKSAKNIANECIEHGYVTSKELLRDIISSKKLSSYLVSGTISIYFFAALPNFDKAVPKLDYFSRIELLPLQKHFEIYHSEVNKAFLQMKNCKINPIEFTDRLICKIRSKRQQKSI